MKTKNQIKKEAVINELNGIVYLLEQETFSDDADAQAWHSATEIHPELSYWTGVQTADLCDVIDTIEESRYCSIEKMKWLSTCADYATVKDVVVKVINDKYNDKF